MDARAAELLESARTSAGLKQSELARRAGMPQPVVSAYERGRREPSVRALRRLLHAAGFDLGLVPRRGPDPAAAGRTLIDLLGLADRLPQRRRAPLRYPRLP
jgi:uncharacterized protein